jgi:hypothetical protein
MTLCQPMLLAPNRVVSLIPPVDYFDSCEDISPVLFLSLDFCYLYIPSLS